MSESATPSAYNLLRDILHKHPHGPLGACFCSGNPHAEDPCPPTLPLAAINIMAWAALVLFPTHTARDPSPFYDLGLSATQCSTVTALTSAMSSEEFIARAMHAADFFQGGRTALVARIWGMPSGAILNVMEAMDPILREALIRAHPNAEFPVTDTDTASGYDRLLKLMCASLTGGCADLNSDTMEWLVCIAAMLPEDCRGQLVLNSHLKLYGSPLPYNTIQGVIHGTLICSRDAAIASFHTLRFSLAQ